MIPVTSFQLSEDGTTATVVDSDRPGVLGGWQDHNRPCDDCSGDPLDTIDYYDCPGCGVTGRHAFEVTTPCPDCSNRAEWCGYDSIGNPACSNGVCTFTVHVLDVTEREDGQWAVQLQIHP